MVVLVCVLVLLVADRFDDACVAFRCGTCRYSRSASVLGLSFVWPRKQLQKAS